VAPVSPTTAMARGAVTMNLAAPACAADWLGGVWAPPMAAVTLTVRDARQIFAVTAQAAVMFDALQLLPPVLTGVHVLPVTVATVKPACAATGKLTVPPCTTEWLG